jgi:hypothetical protein
VSSINRGIKRENLRWQPEPKAMISEAEHSQGQRLGTEETIMYPRDLGDDEHIL